MGGGPLSTATPILQLADAIVAGLNRNFAGDFAAERIYQLPTGAENEDQEHYDTLRVYVVPAGFESSLATRESSAEDLVITIGILQRAEPADLDALVQLAGRVAEWLRFRHFEIERFPRAQWQDVEVNPLFAPAALKERRQFVSVITATYRMRRGV